uniref:THD domain-containing protein n=1 Tax=Anabas testudineus TaxID=64144 RepID=A0A3Q1HK29_ANATE
MEFQSRSSHKYLVLQVWCGLLTVTMVVMAAFLASIKSKSTELDLMPCLSIAVNTFITPLKSVGDCVILKKFVLSPVATTNDSWEVTHKCTQSSLILHNNSVLCKEESIYFIYAHVTFAIQQHLKTNKKVTLKKGERPGKRMRILAEGIFPKTKEGSVWVGKIVKLTNEDSISLDITGDCLKDSTFWGAFQLH